VDFQVWREVAGGIEQTGETFADGVAALERVADLCRTGSRHFVFAADPFHSLAPAPAPAAPLVAEHPVAPDAPAAPAA
jgi:hypothetical protein